LRLSYPAKSNLNQQPLHASEATEFL
jgi:hypothetical protein